MLSLFVIENNRAKPSEAVLIHPLFSEIWERDTTEHKSQAILEYTYMEFLCTYRKSNPYGGMTVSRRSKELGKDLFDNSSFLPDILLSSCIKKYLELQELSIEIQTLKSAKEAIQKTNTFFEKLDYTKETTSGAMVIKPKDVSVALQEMASNLEVLKKLQEKVEREIYTEGKTTKDRVVQLFEDGKYILEILNIEDETERETTTGESTEQLPREIPRDISIDEERSDSDNTKQETDISGDSGDNEDADNVKTDW